MDHVLPNLYPTNTIYHFVYLDMPHKALYLIHVGAFPYYSTIDRNFQTSYFSRLLKMLSQIYNLIPRLSINEWFTHQISPLNKRIPNMLLVLWISNNLR